MAIVQVFVPSLISGMFEAAPALECDHGSGRLGNEVDTALLFQRLPIWTLSICFEPLRPSTFREATPYQCRPTSRSLKNAERHLNSCPQMQIGQPPIFKPSHALASPPEVSYTSSRPGTAPSVCASLASEQSPWLRDSMSQPTRHFPTYRSSCGDTCLRESPRTS